MGLVGPSAGHHEVDQGGQVVHVNFITVEAVASSSISLVNLGVNRIKHIVDQGGQVVHVNTTDAVHVTALNSGLRLFNLFEKERWLGELLACREQGSAAEVFPTERFHIDHLAEFLRREWEEWFGQINDKKEVYTFSMKTGDAQKSLFLLMDNLDDDHLKRLAMLGEDGGIDNLIEKLETLQQQEQDKTARFEHLHKIGKHIEEVLLDRIGRECINIEMPEKIEDVLKVGDIQDGQDIIVKACVNGVWRNIYYIEVKSKWDFNEPAHMSTNQVKMASQHPNEYALCCVDLRRYKEQNLANLPEETIIAATNVKTDIGRTLFPMMSGILDADKKPDETFIKLSDYRSNIPARVFEKGESFETLLGLIEEKAKGVIRGLCY